MPIQNVPANNVEAVGAILVDQGRPLAARFRALFTLRGLGGADAVRAIAACFTDPSALLKHECAYCMGQMQDEAAMATLVDVLRDTEQDTIVRHEAGEALGAIGSEEVLTLLQEYTQDPITEIAETCQLAVQRIRWLHSEERMSEVISTNPYSSVDPAPPCEPNVTANLRDILLDEFQSLFNRYRAMFALRNKGDKESVLALAKGLKCNSALFRHEIAYVLGQIQSPEAISQLKTNLQISSENYMVRHECAEALGSIASPECMAILKLYLKDDSRVVRESCEVALDMAAYETSGDFQYADGLDRVVSKSEEDS